MVKAFQSENIPTSQLTTAISYYEKQQNNKDKGLAPIYQTNTTYSSQLNLITSSVKGILKSNGAEAIRNATNYAIIEMEEFEQSFIKDNQRKPTNQERREFMIKLGDYITKTFRDDQTDPDIMTMTEKEQFDREEEAKRQLQEEQNQLAFETVKENLQTITTNIANQIQALPAYEDTGLPDITKTKENAFKRKQLLDLAKKNVEELFNVEIDDSFLKYLEANKEVITPTLLSLAEAYQISPKDLQEILKQLAVGN
jgi:ribosomal protein L14E/L6E/L27E